MKHVIIGVGAAGISAAQTIRKHRKDDEIVMISIDEAVISRCMLHKYIGGNRDVKALAFVEPNFFQNNNIIWHSGKKVTDVDAANKTVHFDGGSVNYDKLLIATGAKSAFPPIEGLKEAASVYGLRDLSDAEAIRKKAKTAENIVIIGAGLVGLDAAYGFVEMSKRPTIIDMSSSVLSSNLDQYAADIYHVKFEEAGCNFHLGNKVINVHRDVIGNVSHIALDNSEELLCDLLIVSTGIHPENVLLNGEKPDKYLNVRDKDIFVAGDASGKTENWLGAVEQGEVAALNMCGILTLHDKNFLQRNTANFFGVASLSVGQFHAEADDVCDVRQDKGRYQKLILRNGIPVGIILQGDISRGGFWQHIIKNKINITDIPKSIWKISFADAYSLNENGEYEWVN